MMYDWDYKANFIRCSPLAHISKLMADGATLDFGPAALSSGKLQAQTRADALEQLKTTLGDPLPNDLVLTRLV